MENQTVQPTITEVGKIWGRDAIYLDRVNMINESTFEISGSFNGSLCENLNSGDFKSFDISFNAVHLFKMIELDFDETEYQSAFDEVLHSEQINHLIALDQARSIGKIDTSYRHFVFRTYDTVFEIICKGFELKMT
ncbi:MAG: hypothetical protein AB8F95_07675 [Bacteroidia bacterium]